MIKKPSTSTNVLLTLGVLFTIGGATRFLPSFAEAEETAVQAETAAYTSGVSHADNEAHPESDTLTPPEVTAAAPENVCFTDEAAAALTEDQRQFEAQQQAQLDQQLALDARQVELDRQAAELQALHETLETRWASMQAAADEDLAHLARMYGAMKPREAASIFNQMDPGFAAGFLKLMPSEQAGQVLAGMESDKAYIVSVKLASVNADIRSPSDMN